ncbi:Protein-glutamine gamma-glutamyltransferase [Maioricimonas rarisocia]|uniref:Protein-glutamine gamma-glutamyltransferase n=1 Tax=Maioricimonas rarisocia TaxID=2528026 RepID=A0A517Z694_9PLAN|nr:transglutaminase domain-containing protein [Maioricimonas rarisocia]QDU38003.1 Protein-glutamine gamma-glutamyltransferase [Maioricimonas rarisocia]
MSPDSLPQTARIRSSTSADLREIPHRSTSAGSARSQPQLQVVATILAMLAISTFAVICADGVASPGLLIWLAVQLLSMAAGGWLMRRLSRVRPEPPAISPVLVVLGLFPLVTELPSRHFLGIGHPLEMITMCVVRNVVIGLTIMSVWHPYQRLCVVMSLFLSLFGLTATRDLAAQILVGCFAIGGAIWLVMAHWESMRRRLRGRQKARLPVAAMVVPLLVVAACLLAARNDRVAVAMRGWLPSSGGEGASDPYARNGVGDGEQLVAGSERVQSFAPLEDAPFVQDDRPSLYDIFDDTYEEPLEVTQTDRAVALPPDLASRINEHLQSRMEKATREFSTDRARPESKSQRKAETVHSDALFHVVGRVPLHLRLEVYDLFDGIHWYPGKVQEFRPPLSIRQSEGKPWLTLPDRGGDLDYLGAAETHALKIVHLDSKTIPAPLFLHGVHIDRVDREEMFTHGPDGLVAMNRKRIPALVPIHIASRSIDRRALAGSGTQFRKAAGYPASALLPTAIDEQRLRRLAASITSERANGWDEISAVVEHLRREYEHDSSARRTGTDGTPVEDFLFDTQRGPDYQFATAAAVLLRCLGYSTRVVSGFYVDPEKYDPLARQTSVYTNDVHFWTEVRVSGGDWVTLEPTPGYEVLGPPPTWLDNVLASLNSTAAWTVDHWVAISVGLLAMSLLLYRRNEVLDTLDLLAWRVRPGRDASEIALRSFALLQRRARRARHTWQPGTTARSWLISLKNETDDAAATRLTSAAQLIEAAAYAQHSNVSDEDFRRVLHLWKDLLDRHSLAWFRNSTARRRQRQQRAQNVDATNST